MVKNIFVKLFAATMAVWAAWSLGTLASGLQTAASQAQALQDALVETETEIRLLQQDSVEDILRSMGYVYRGDIVFFDGG